MGIPIISSQFHNAISNHHIIVVVFYVYGNLTFEISILNAHKKQSYVQNKLEGGD